MLSIIFFFNLFMVVYHVADAVNWALIVAGSNEWYNYRHQADACHAYQILHKNGIPDDNIVVMMYDDIAHNEGNPTPGKIINQPDGEDVYAGVPKDYVGMDVTPENFLNILKGNKSAMADIGSGKVINSGPDDYVFVNFVDHGAPDLIAFPDGELYSRDLKHAIQYMYENKKYKQMVFYIEACESGSMFSKHKLSSHINVFATTAANGRESSYACYYDQKRRTYLGDVYSVNWMENSDKVNMGSESLQTQYKIVKEETNTSHVMEFGNMSISEEPIGYFQGENVVPTLEAEMYIPREPITDAVPSPDVPLMIMEHELKAAKTEEEKKEILHRIKLEKMSRMKIKSTVQKIAEKLVPQTHPDTLSRVLGKQRALKRDICYKHAVKKFRKHCFDLNKYEHALRHIYVLANLCDEGFSIESIHLVIEETCVPKTTE